MSPKKILKINNPPPITSYSTDATVLSILSLEDNIDYMWFFEKYVPMIAINDGILFTAFPNTNDFYCPQLSQEEIGVKRVLETDNCSIIDFIIENIDNEAYMSLSIDTFYVKTFWSYNSSHYYHPIFIYGYDVESQEIYFGDFIGGEGFKFTKASFSEITNSVLEPLSDDSLSDCWRDTIAFLFKKRKVLDYSIENVIQAIEKYISGSHIHCTFIVNEPIWYGLDAVYDKVIFELGKYNNGEDSYDRRIPAIYCDHIKVLLMLSEFLCGRYISVNNTEALEKMYQASLVARNKLLKADVTQQHKKIDLDLFLDNRDKERVLLSKIKDLFGN